MAALVLATRRCGSKPAVNERPDWCAILRPHRAGYGIPIRRYNLHRPGRETASGQVVVDDKTDKGDVGQTDAAVRQPSAGH
jgi:hypothetical protein